MIIYINSKESLSVHPNNTAGKFTVELPKTFSARDNGLSRGRWFMGLIEIIMPPVGTSSPKWEVLNVMCPHVEGVVHSCTYSPILRSIPHGEIRRYNYARFSSVLHVPLRVTDIANISIEVRNSTGELTPELALETNHSTSCTIELIWRRDTNL